MASRHSHHTADHFRAAVKLDKILEKPHHRKKTPKTNSTGPGRRIHDHRHHAHLLDLLAHEGISTAVPFNPNDATAKRRVILQKIADEKRAVDDANGQIRSGSKSSRVLRG
jgi:hypothetical protein